MFREFPVLERFSAFDWFMTTAFSFGASLMAAHEVKHYVNDQLLAPSVDTAQLPFWEGDAKGLTAITIYPGRILKHTPWIKDVGISEDRIMHPHRFPLAGYYPLPLPGGWQVVALKATGALKTTIFKLSHPATGREDSYILQGSLPFGSDGTVYEGYLLNNSYYGFHISESNYLFFDRVAGKFIPNLLKTTCGSFRYPRGPAHTGGGCKTTDLFVAPNGQIVVDDPSTQTLRTLVLAGKGLAAPVEQVEIAQVKAGNALSNCLLSVGPDLALLQTTGNEFASPGVEQCLTP